METITKDTLTNLIVSRLNENKEYLKNSFEKSKSIIGVRYCYLDNLLPDYVALSISTSFPKYYEMRHMNSFRENKYTSKSFEKFDPLLMDMTYAIQDIKVIYVIEEITTIKDQQADPSLYAGGLSMMPKNCFLNPHIDNSHDGNRINYRTLNLLYYASNDWKEEYGGNLELWDNKVKNKIMVHSKFNRLVLMETNPWSWHSVSKVEVEQSRNCISNYYFSKYSPIGKNYFNITSYSARPEQRFRSVQFKADNLFRKSLRFLFPYGLGKRDIYISLKNK